jgi:hypothetical protein
MQSEWERARALDLPAAEWQKGNKLDAAQSFASRNASARRPFASPAKSMGKSNKSRRRPARSPFMCPGPQIEWSAVRALKNEWVAECMPVFLIQRGSFSFRALPNPSETLLTGGENWSEQHLWWSSSYTWTLIETLDVKTPALAILRFSSVKIKYRTIEFMFT